MPAYPSGTVTVATAPNPGTLAAGDFLLTKDGGILMSDGLSKYTGIKGSSPIPAHIVPKMRALAVSSGLQNPATAQPLIQPSAWVTATAYGKGQSVSNAGNNYTCITPIASSAAAPTLTTNGAQTDGSGAWYYMGPTFTTSALAPTFTNVLFAARYSTGTYWTNSANTRNDGAVNVLDDLNFLVTGSPVTATGGNNGWRGAAQSIMFQVSFMTDETSFQIETSGGTFPIFSIYVNGVPLTLGVGSLAANGTSINYAQLVFATKAVRQITVELPTGTDFLGVLTSTKTSKVWAPSIPNNFRMAITGSSFISGSAQHPVTTSLAWGSLTAKLMNCSDYWQDANGAGSGYIAGTNFFTASRFNALVAYAPDVVVIAGGGINDANIVPAVSVATEQAAVLAYLKQLRAALPAALILVIGAEAGAKGPTTAIFNMELAAAQGVAQFADANCFFIPQSSTSAESAWVSGTGTTAATNGTGNSEIYIGADTTHPVQAGCLYYAQRSANGIMNLLNNIVLT